MTTPEQEPEGRVIPELRALNERAGRRMPELDRPVYALGHYEQMLVHRALNADYLTPDEWHIVAGLLHIFESHGTVTIIRQEDGL